VKTETVKVNKPQDVNVILGQSHFIKTVEDLHEAAVNSVPGIKFGLAFCEASDKRLIRYSGNNDEMIELATTSAEVIGAGHSFVIFIRDAFPINLLNAIKNVPEVCRIFCASANDVEVIIGETQQGRGILGVIDGASPLGIENNEDKEWRLSFLRKIGYKL